MNYLLTGQETERLKFRILQPDDFDTWLPMFKADNIAKFLDLDATLSEFELCKQWFEKAFNRYDHNLGGMNVLIDKKSDQLVGQCGVLVQMVEDIERLEIGYSVLPKFWGRGYASEAALKCKNYAFEHNFSDVLMSMIHVDNISAKKVALRNGMTFEKQIKNFNIFSIHKERWELTQ